MSWKDSERRKTGSGKRPGVRPLAAISRRDFLSIAGLSAAGLVFGCGGSERVSGPAARMGTVRGTVTDLHGAPQGIGRIYLLLESGLNQNLYADVSSSGAFDFGRVAVGNYQLRYWGDNLADVPDPFENPVRITVTENTPTVVQFKIIVGTPDAADQEIYAGDDFYQQQPYGDLNGTVVVKQGTLVCWYNVGLHDHTVTGGPWGDSGTISRAGNFMWTADQVGTFPYRCSFHNPQMQAVLQVVP